MVQAHAIPSPSSGPRGGAPPVGETGLSSSIDESAEKPGTADLNVLIAESAAAPDVDIALFTGPLAAAREAWLADNNEEARRKLRVVVAVLRDLPSSPRRNEFLSSALVLLGRAELDIRGRSADAYRRASRFYEAALGYSGNSSEPEALLALAAAKAHFFDDSFINDFERLLRSEPGAAYVIAARSEYLFGLELNGKHKLAIEQARILAGLDLTVQQLTNLRRLLATLREELPGYRAPDVLDLQEILETRYPSQAPAAYALAKADTRSAVDIASIEDSSFIELLEDTGIETVLAQRVRAASELARRYPSQALTSLLGCVLVGWIVVFGPSDAAATSLNAWLLASLIGFGFAILVLPDPWNRAAFSNLEITGAALSAAFVIGNFLDIDGWRGIIWPPTLAVGLVIVMVAFVWDFRRIYGRLTQIGVRRRIAARLAGSMIAVVFEGALWLALYAYVLANLDQDFLSSSLLRKGILAIDTASLCLMLLWSWWERGQTRLKGRAEIIVLISGLLVVEIVLRATWGNEFSEIVSRVWWRVAFLALMLWATWVRTYPRYIWLFTPMIAVFVLLNVAVTFSDEWAGLLSPAVIDSAKAGFVALEGALPAIGLLLTAWQLVLMLRRRRVD